MNERARALWAKTDVIVWPERYLLIQLGVDALREACDWLARHAGRFHVLVLERDEVSLTVDEQLWQAAPLDVKHEREGPFAAISLDAPFTFDLTGYLALAAVELEREGVSMIPQCAYGKDHLLVPHPRLDQALAALSRCIGEGA